MLVKIHIIKGRACAEESLVVSKTDDSCMSVVSGPSSLGGGVTRETFVVDLDRLKKGLRDVEMVGDDEEASPNG
jgi:hypothetical protein